MRAGGLRLCVHGGHHLDGSPVHVGSWGERTPRGGRRPGSVPPDAGEDRAARQGGVRRVGAHVHSHGGRGHDELREARVHGAWLVRRRAVADSAGVCLPRTHGEADQRRSRRLPHDRPHHGWCVYVGSQPGGPAGLRELQPGKAEQRRRLLHPRAAEGDLPFGRRRDRRRRRLGPQRGAHERRRGVHLRSELPRAARPRLSRQVSQERARAPVSVRVCAP
mmetsp:Transcript_19332/g.73029  ORF Transcript_19332/g.73029 Transcript_19332/m.73029 type:complete len:220 (+) Transcript_19332:649-1308(+)